LGTAESDVNGKGRDLQTNQSYCLPFPSIEPQSKYRYAGAYMLTQNISYHLYPSIVAGSLANIKRFHQFIATIYQIIPVNENGFYFFIADKSGLVEGHHKALEFTKFPYHNFDFFHHEILVSHAEHNTSFTIFISVI
jgi:hypothetical protein